LVQKQRKPFTELARISLVKIKSNQAKLGVVVPDGVVVSTEEVRLCKDILIAIDQNPTIKDGILCIETNEWLVPIKRYVSKTRRII
tara:strand:- start:49 stop:306 length:258 start_codon:yes stop_codon:yes gene_type:complete